MPIMAENLREATVMLAWGLSARWNSYLAAAYSMASAHCTRVGSLWGVEAVEVGD
jgi:hypothetical protein